MFVHYCDSPLGKLTLLSDGEAITGLYFDRQIANAAEQALPVLLDAERQLAEYFGHWRESFDLPLRPAGTPFQQSVWEALLKIPYGETVSYAALAHQLGRDRAVRAVGRANGQNPISILIPCHRVIGSDGKLTGYGGGIWRKEYLLKHERPAAESLLAFGSTTKN